MVFPFRMLLRSVANGAAFRFAAVDDNANNISVWTLVLPDSP